MSLARQYARTLRRHLRCRPVWPPMIDIVPGDYGVFQGGVFVRIGSVAADFGVPVVVEPGGRRVDKFQYHSDGKFGLAGGVEAGVGSAEVGLDVELAHRASFFVSISNLDSVRLQSPRAVALRLRNHPHWPHRRYAVVAELYRGSDLVFYGSESGGGGFSLRGSPAEINLFQSTGKIGGDLKLSASGAVSAQFRGSPDVQAGFGLVLFRVKSLGVEPMIMHFASDGSESDDEPLEELSCDVDDDPDDAA